MRTALLTLLIVAAPVLAGDADKDYYPMAIGAKWTYKIGKQDEKFVWTAMKTDKVGDQECVVFEAKLKDQVVGSEYLAVLKDGIYRFKLSDKVISPPVCFFKSPGEKGESWKLDFKVDESKTSAVYSSEKGEVAVPAGVFKDAVVVKTEATSGGMVVKSTIWFVKDVGMVKQDFDLGNVKYSLELEKVELPKK